MLIAVIVDWELLWLWAVLAVAGVAILAFLVWLSIKWPEWHFARASYRLNEMGLEIRLGVVWRVQIAVPIARVQHADVSQGPLQRQFGLGKLTIHTAGTHNASVELDGLAHETALELRDLIVRQRGTSDVV
jgi:membrane protein YdbS with pleckstrin-like domain